MTSQKGSATPVIVTLVVLIVLVAGVIAAYKANRQSQIAVPGNLQGSNVQPAADKSKTDTSDQQLNKDLQDVDNNLKSLDQDLTQADQGLNDQMGDLSE